MGTFLLTPGPFTQSGSTFTTNRALSISGAVTMTGGLTLNTLSLSGALTTSSTITGGALSGTTLTLSGTGTVNNLVSNTGLSFAQNSWLTSGGNNLLQNTGSTLAIQGGYNNVQIQTTSGTAIATYTNTLITYAQPLLVNGNLKLPASGVLYGQVSGGADVAVLTWDSSGNTTICVKAGQSLYLQDSASASIATLTTSGVTLPGTLQVTGTTTLSSTLTLSGGLVQTTQSGAANGLSYRTWNGTTAVVPWSIGGQFNSALAYVDSSGNITTPKLTANSGKTLLTGPGGTGAALGFGNTASISNLLIDLQQSYGLYSDNTGLGPAGSRLWLNAPNGGEVIIGCRAGSSYLNDLTVISNQIILTDTNGSRLDTSNSIQSGGTYFGFKDSSSNKLAEMKAGGNFLINGAYQTHGATTTITGSQSFDTFDYAECFPFDQDYPNGTIVCLQEQGVMSRCTHPGCPRAQIVSLHPGYMTGNPDADDPADHVQPVALMGRVKVSCTSTCRLGDFVYSAGDGTVTTQKTDPHAFALGYCISAPDQDGVIGLMVRPGVY